VTRVADRPSVLPPGVHVPVDLDPYRQTGRGTSSAARPRPPRSRVCESELPTQLGLKAEGGMRARRSRGPLGSSQVKPIPRLPNPHRRVRPTPLRRPSTTGGDRPSALPRTPDPDLRRSDERPGQRSRTRSQKQHGPPPGRTHRLRHRPPTNHHPRRRPHLRTQTRTNRRTRHPRRPPTTPRPIRLPQAQQLDG